jgi:glycosyltransferase involved in cell wall biosynthesis
LRRICPQEKASIRSAASGDLVLQAPLVSILISNYNYGRFLQDAIDSARAQTYPHVECIVVDDASTDNSSEVLDTAAHNWPELKLVRLSHNSGQSVAILEGLARASGDFILFLDADDMLFPECVAYHLAVHMSCRRAIGFSCSDSVQIVNERIVIGRHPSLSNAFMRLPVDLNLVSGSAQRRLAANGISLPAIAAESVRHVSPTYSEWPWSSTSCMLFRRDALDLICGASGLRDLRIGTDNYLAKGVNQLTGSVLLDEQLVAYRLHGSNNFTRRPPLDGFTAHHKADEHDDQTRRILLDDLMMRFEHYSAFIDWPERILYICSRLDVLDPEQGPPSSRSRSRFLRLLIRRRDEITLIVGRATMTKWMLHLRMPLWLRQTIGLRK